MKKFLLIAAICLLFCGCRDSEKSYPFTFVERSDVFPPKTGMQKSQPLMLVVEIDESGRLSLNKIEIGTISDLSVLSEKIEAIFEDRRNTGIAEREIFIDLQGTIKSADLEKLIENLAARKAAPIRVIRK